MIEEGYDDSQIFFGLTIDIIYHMLYNEKASAQFIVVKEEV